MNTSLIVLALWLGPQAAAQADRPEVRLREARAARRAGRFDEAERRLTDFQLRGGAREVVQLEQALLRAQQGDVDPVEVELRGLLKKHKQPEAALILEALTEGYTTALQLVEARDSLKQWRGVDPPDAQGYFLRARAQERLANPSGDWGKENHTEFAGLVNDYRQALRTDPRHERAQVGLATLQLEGGQLDEASSLFEAALKLRPAAADALLGLSRCHAQRGGLETAEKLLDKVLEMDPRHPVALTEKGRVALQAGKLEQSQNWLRRALAVRPHDREATYALFQCLRQLGRREEAGQVQARFKQIDADLKRLKELRDALWEKGGDPARRCEGGLLLLRNGEPEQAVRWLSSALRNDPNYRPAHAALADYYERAGKKDLAEKHRRLAKQRSGS